MEINRDENRVPDIPAGMAEEAIRTGSVFFVVSILGSRIAQFYALAPFRPNIGESILSQEGIECKVTDVIFSVVPSPYGMRLVPNVFAIAGPASADTVQG